MGIVTFMLEVFLQQEADADFAGVAEFLAIPGLFFVGGFLTGFATATMMKSRKKTNVKHSIAMIVTFSWVVSMLASIAVPSYTTSFFIHAIMGAVAGYLFQREDGSVAIPGVGTTGGDGNENHGEKQ